MTSEDGLLSITAGLDPTYFNLQVLLYDFFADSAASASDWKALSKIYRLDRPGALNINDLNGRHGILQAEIKCLYVGLTRAREHVWLWDSSTKGAAFEVGRERPLKPSNKLIHRHSV